MDLFSPVTDLRGVGPRGRRLFIGSVFTRSMICWPIFRAIMRIGQTRRDRAAAAGRSGLF